MTSARNRYLFLKLLKYLSHFRTFLHKQKIIVTQISFDAIDVLINSLIIPLNTIIV